MKKISKQCCAFRWKRTGFINRRNVLTSEHTFQKNSTFNVIATGSDNCHICETIVKEKYEKFLVELRSKSYQIRLRSIYNKSILDLQQIYIRSMIG